MTGLCFRVSLGDMTAREYQAIVVGASFGGLAVARQLRGDVLLLDRNEVGAVQTSACGTPLWVPEALGVGSSVLQVHQRFLLKSSTRTIHYDLSAVPFCTFDYRRFCQGLLAQCDARFLRTAVTGFEDGVVVTRDGRFTAPVVVDCSGWRSVLVHGARTTAPATGSYSFGLETHTDRDGDDLVFFFDDSMDPRALGWVFPVGAGSLIGLGSYTGDSKLRSPLDRLLRAQELAPSTYHGTYFPNRLLRATAGRVFVVGDAAGQCLPLTAEGIRPALYFGTQCGALIQCVLDGRLALEAALESYLRLVERYRSAYRLLRWVQWLAMRAPTRWFAMLAALGNRAPLLPRWWPRYGQFGRLAPAPIGATP